MSKFNKCATVTKVTYIFHHSRGIYNLVYIVTNFIFYFNRVPLLFCVRALDCYSTPNMHSFQKLRREPVEVCLDCIRTGGRFGLGRKSAQVGCRPDGAATGRSSRDYRAWQCRVELGQISRPQRAVRQTNVALEGPAQRDALKGRRRKRRYSIILQFSRYLCCQIWGFFLNMQGIPRYNKYIINNDIKYNVLS